MLLTLAEINSNKIKNEAVMTYISEHGEPKGKLEAKIFQVEEPPSIIVMVYEDGLKKCYYTLANSEEYKIVGSLNQSL